MLEDGHENLLASMCCCTGARCIAVMLMQFMQSWHRELERFDVLQHVEPACEFMEHIVEAACFICIVSAAAQDLSHHPLPDPAMQHWFPVSFDFRFTDRLSIYHVVGPAEIPDAESLLIPLLRQQIHGTPMRMGEGDDWMLLTWQTLDGMLIPWMPEIQFQLYTRMFFVVGLS